MVLEVLKQDEICAKMQSITCVENEASNAPKLMYHKYTIKETPYVQKWSTICAKNKHYKLQTWGTILPNLIYHMHQNEAQYAQKWRTRYRLYALKMKHHSRLKWRSMHAKNMAQNAKWQWHWLKNKNTGQGQKLKNYEQIWSMDDISPTEFILGANPTTS